MGLGKTYSTKYLLDSNNSSGVAGQVLSTTSTGIDWVDANTVPGSGLWLENGNDIYNSNSGNVGIGTDDPQDLLEVRAANGVTGVIRVQGGKNAVTSIGETNSRLDFGSNDNSVASPFIGGRIASITEATNGSKTGLGFSTYLQSRTGADLMEFMRIDNLGNVGIGTNTPSAKLHLRDAGTDSDVGIKIGNDSRDWNLKVMGSVSDSLQFFTHDNSNIMTILPSGNVGIGTDSPGRGLTIDKSNEFAALEIIKNNTTNQIVYLGTGSSGATDDTILQMKHSAVEKIRLHTTGSSWLNGGNVGIGVTGPGEKLEIDGNIRIHNSSNAPYIDFTESAAVTDSKARITMDQIDTDNGSLLFSTEGGGTLSERMSISSVGLATFRSTYVIAGFYGGEITLGGSDTTFGLQLKYNQDASTTSTLYHSPGYSNDDNLFKLGAGSGNTNQLVLKGDGNVGIGTDSPDAILETSKEVDGNQVGALLTNTRQAGTADSVSLNFGLGRTADGFIFNTAAIKLLKEQQWTGTGSTIDGALVFSTIQNETVSEKMRIDSDGNVGITAAAYLGFNGAGDPSHSVAYNAGIDGVQLRGQNGVIFGTGGGATAVERMKIQSNGQVNISQKPNSGLAYDVLINVGTSPDGLIGYQSVDDLAANLGASTSSNWVKSGNDIYNTNSANVGIGTTSPGASLAVQANFTANGGYTTSGWAKYIILDAENTGGGGIIWTKQSSTYNRAILNNQGKFEIGRSTANDDSAAWIGDLVIDASGNVGIGIENPSDYNASFDDLVLGGSSNHGMTIKSGTSSLGQISFADGTSGDAAYRGLLRYDHAVDSFVFYTSGFNERMRINASGNVGIGTTGPNDGKLQIHTASAINYTPTSFMSGTNIRLNTGGTAAQDVTTGISMGIGGAAEAYIGAVQNVSTYADIVFQTYHGSYGERMRISSAGNVLINDTSGLEKLKVVQDANSEWACRINHVGTSPYGLAIDTSANTGVYALGVYTNTGTGLFVKNDGNVGIGTGTPTAPLAVHGQQKWFTTNGDGNELRGLFNPGGAGDPAELSLYQANGTSVGIELRATGDSYFVGGNVGIGTTGPSEKLEVDGNVQIGATTDARLYMVSTGGNGNNERFFIEGYADGGTYGGGFKLSTRNDVNVFSTAVAVNRNGNVGIGMTNPLAPLTIYNSSSIGSSINIQNNVSGTGLGQGFYLGISTGIEAYVWNYENADLVFAANNSEGMRIKSSGDALFSGTVGINMTTTPTEKLDVDGNIKVHGDLMLQSGSSIVLTDQPTANTGGGTIVNWSVSDTVTAGLLYVLKTNGAWTTTDADVEARSTGMLAIAIASNAINGMLLQGFLYKASHGFTIGLPLYISNTAGAFTTTRPTGTNDYVRIIGYATSANYIYFDPDKTWVQVA